MQRQPFISLEKEEPCSNVLKKQQKKRTPSLGVTKVKKPYSYENMAFSCDVCLSRKESHKRYGSVLFCCDCCNARFRRSIERMNFSWPKFDVLFNTINSNFVANLKLKKFKTKKHFKKHDNLYLKCNICLNEINDSDELFDILNSTNCVHKWQVCSKI